MPAFQIILFGKQERENVPVNLICRLLSRSGPLLTSAVILR